MTIAMPVEPEANELLSRSPLALLIGMVLDQQVPLERAFSAPLDLVRRLGHEPTTAELAEFDPVALADIFAERPALHRFPRAMAARVQEVARLIMHEYDGGGVHGLNEHIRVDSLMKGRTYLYRLIKVYAGAS